jgi:hypothetical protein
MLDLKRTVTELVALYTLENVFQDIYVEGISDRFFIQNYLRWKNCSKKIIPIELVSFEGIPSTYGTVDLKSNRDKLITLSLLIDDLVPETSVLCLIDRDFDDFIPSITNSKLLRTDFACMESYLLSSNVIQKFFEIGLGGFPFKADYVINELSVVLKALFNLRLVRHLHFRPAQLLQIDGNLNINKSTGQIVFNGPDYIEKFLNKNQLKNQEEEISKNLNNWSSKLSEDIRKTIQGHDFISILFLYINKIKNSPKFKEESFERALFLSVEPESLEQHTLFKALVS